MVRKIKESSFNDDVDASDVMNPLSDGHAGCVSGDDK
jgi:hypothetical protein